MRLGRCPKKDKPSKSNFYRLPQNRNGAVDVDKQIKTEQLVLTLHDAYRSAEVDFQKLYQEFATEDVSFYNNILLELIHAILVLQW